MKNRLLFAFFVFLSSFSFGQITITPGPTGAALTSSFMGNGLTATNVVINCNAQSYGTFANGNTTNLGLTNGLLMTTGLATQAPVIGGSSSGNDASFCVGTSVNDPQLTSIEPSATNDVCIIEFDVTAVCNQLQVRFVFGSEEYPEYVNAGVNDAFGFFVSGPNPGGGNYTNFNIARLPNNSIVSIDNVNAGVNSAFYVSNSGTTIEYDAFTTVITYSLNLTPCANYHFKLAIGDAGDCIIDSGVFIDFIACTTPPINVTTASTAASCGANDGTATATVTGGAGPFNYSWNTTPVQTTATATGLAPGNYTVTVTSTAFPCLPPSTSTVTVGGSGAAPTVTVTPTTGTICNGGNVSLTAAGGTSYTWSPATGLSSTTGATVTASPTTTTTYTVTGTGACGTGTASATITVNPVPTTTAGSNSPLCVGATLNLTATNSTGATYSWTGPGGFTSTQQNPSLPNVTTGNAGTYTVTVSANGCTSTSTVNVAVNSTFNATITPAGPFCVNDPAITLLAVDAGGSWSGNGITNAATGIFTPSVAGAGTHTITYTIPGACGAAANTSITVNPAVSAAITPVGPFCVGDPAITLTGATPGGTWSGNGITNASTGTFDPATAGQGTHTITYTIGGACGDSQTTTITVNTTSNATITPAGPFCVNNANAFLAAVTPGGSWSGNGIVNASTGEFSPTAAGAGTHTITYTISGSCGDVQTTTIQVIANANATVNPAGPFCVSDPATTLTSVNPGGTWSGNGITSAANGTFDPSVAGNGTHTITYTISGVCGDAQSITINVVSILPTTITPVNPICINASPITLSGASPGGTWSGTGITNTTTGIFDPAVAGAGTHTITYTIAGNCGSTSTTNITVNPLPIISFNVDINSGCVPVTSTFTNTTPGASNCNWLIDGVPASTSCSMFTHTFTQVNCFDITLVTTDNNGCSNTATINDMVCTFPIPNADFTFTPTNTTVLNPTVNFTNQSTGGTIYQWDFAGLGTSTQTNPSFTFPDSAASYLVCLNVSNASGCSDDICKVVTIYDELLIYVPNAFTPDGDGKNDVFLPIVAGIDPNSYEFFIFNRWGELIFETDVVGKGWDGTYRGKLSQQDVYVWKIKARNALTGQEKVYYGHVSLLK